MNSFSQKPPPPLPLVEPDWAVIALPTRFVKHIRKKFPGRPMREVIVEAIQTRSEVKRKSGVDIPNDTITVVKVRLPMEIKEMVEKRKGRKIVVDAVESFLQRDCDPPIESMKFKNPILFNRNHG